MNLKVDICIVGAGPGGSLLAFLLARKNITVALIERDKEVGKAFRGEHLNEEGEAILKKYGLFEEIEQLGLLRMEKLEYWQDGKPFKTILPQPEIGHLGIHVPQANLLSVLIKSGTHFPNLTCMMNTRVADLLKDDAGNYCGVLAIQNGQEITIDCQLIIGADGRNSTVRKKAEIEVNKRKHGYDLLWARIPSPEGWEPSIKMALINNKQLSLFTQTNDFIQVGWNIEEGSFSTLRKEPFTAFIQQLVEAFPDLNETVHKHIQSWKDFVLLDVYSTTSENWGSSGLVLIGDAIHTMTPTGAFGLNSALKDADYLAKLIDKDYVTLLDSFDCSTQRKREIEKIQASQIEKEQSFASQFTIML
ncbi:NAD(P)-binding protein [Bacillus sp. N3536]|nr:NAD(P)-binding protein [Bacillus sp. N3536]